MLLLLPTDQNEEQTTSRALLPNNRPLLSDDTLRTLLFGGSILMIRICLMLDGSFFTDELLLSFDFSELAVEDHVAESEADAAFAVAGLELLHELADCNLAADADSLLDGLFDLL